MRAQPQPRRVQDAAGRLELPGSVGGGVCVFGDAGTAGEWGTRHHEVAAALREWQWGLPEWGGLPGHPCLPRPPSPACPAAHLPEGRGGKASWGSQEGEVPAQHPSGPGTSGFGVQKDTKGPPVSTLCLSFPAPAFASPVGSPLAPSHRSPANG